MKIDVEFLKKHRFWILLGLAVFLLLPSCVALGPGVSSALAVKNAEVDKRINALTGKKDVKSDEWVEVAKKRAEKSKQQETEVWAEAWRSQEYDFTWPKEFEAKYHFQNGWFARSITAEVKVPEPPAP